MYTGDRDEFMEYPQSPELVEGTADAEPTGSDLAGNGLFKRTMDLMTNRSDSVLDFYGNPLGHGPTADFLPVTDRVEKLDASSVSCSCTSSWPSPLSRFRKGKRFPENMSCPGIIRLTPLRRSLETALEPKDPLKVRFQEALTRGTGRRSPTRMSAQRSSITSRRVPSSS